MPAPIFDGLLLHLIAYPPFFVVNIFIRNYLEIMYVFPLHATIHLFYFVWDRVSISCNITLHSVCVHTYHPLRIRVWGGRRPHENQFFCFLNYRSQALRICNIFVISSGPDIVCKSG